MGIKQKQECQCLHDIFDWLLILICILFAIVFLMPYLKPFEDITFEAILYEFIFLSCIYIVFLLILNRYIQAFIFLGLLYLLVLVINRFIISFYGRSINLNDFYLWFDFEYLLHYLQIYLNKILFLLFFGIISISITVFITKKCYKKDFVAFGGTKIRLGCLIFMLVSGYLFFNHISTKFLESRLSQQCRFSSMCIYLPVTSMIMHASDFINIDENVKKDFEYYRSIKQKIPIDNIEDNADVVVILNESTFNPSFLSVVRNLNFEMFKDSQPLEVQVFGGTTWNSQFQVLTGIDLSFFKKPIQHNPYPILDYYQDTLPKILKKYHYKSFAITNIPRRFNAQGKNYNNYGFQAYYDVDGIASMKAEDTYCDRDHVMFEMVKKILSDAEKQNKFIYVETMCNHGPHDKSLDTSKVSCGDLNPDTCSMVLDYINRLKIVNGQVISLMNYIKYKKKKTVILFFGDHYPSFEGEMSPLLRKYNKDPYKTFYSVQTNFKINQDIFKPIKVSEVQKVILDVLKH